MEFLKLAEGAGHFYKQKTMHFALNFYMQKEFTFRYVFILKKPENVRHIFTRKKQYTLRYIFIPKIVRSYIRYLTINIRTIRAIISINKSKIFIENWSYSYDK